MSYTPYPAYKDSGVPWLGQVPEGWEVKRLRYASKLADERLPYDEVQRPYVGLEHIESWTGKRIPDDEARAEGVVALFDRGDVLFGKLRPYLAKVHRADEAGCSSTEALILRGTPVLDTHFLKYFMLSPAFIDEVNATTYGAKMPRANWSDVGGLPVSLPTIEEQTAIAEFLDRKTAEIDDLIAKKEELLRLLAEQRTALITHAVTKGLNPNATMKPSGIDWLGDVPEGWEVVRLRHLLAAPLKYGANETAEFEERLDPRYIRITDVREDGTLREETFRSLPEQIAAPYLLEDGDILLARSGATVGKTFIYRPSWGRAAFAGYLIRARVNDRILPSFLYGYLQSKAYWGWLNSVFIQATIQNVSAEKYASLSVPIPPFEAQQDILEKIESETASLDIVSNEIHRAISHLKEYRTALITNAVTGKIDIRNHSSKI